MLRFRPEVAADLRSAQEWYEARRRGLGHEFILALESLLERVDATPGEFPSVYGKVHRALLRRFPYAVFFIIEGDDRVVLGVLHQAVDPSRWPAP